MVRARQPQLRAQAAADIDEAITYLRDNAGDAVALAFIDTLEGTMAHVARSPNAGSLLFAYELGIPNLSARSVRRFPYAIFYVPVGDHIDIWRVLHTRRDIPGPFRHDL